MTVLAPQPSKLLFGFYTFGNNLCVYQSTHRNDEFRNRAVSFQISYERAIDL
jgi:hypothetical protein